MPPQPTASSSGQAKRPMSYPHMAWAAGHLLVLVGAVFTLLPMVKFAAPSSKAYTLGFAGAIVSWTVVVFKSLGVPNASRAYVQRALLDENAQYLLLAISWFFQKPIAIAIAPYAVFSFFHALNFVRQTFLPSAKAGVAGPQQGGFPMQLSRGISNFSKQHYEKAMVIVAYIEIFVMLRVTLGAIAFRNSLLAPLVFAHFLRFRYYVSAATRTAFNQLNGRIDGFTSSQSCPPAVRSGVNTAKGLITRYADSVLHISGAQQQQGAAAPAAGAAAGVNANNAAAAAAQAHRAR